MKTALLSLAAGAALASSPLNRGLEADDFLNIFLQNQPIVFSLGANTCELRGLGDLTFVNDGAVVTLTGEGGNLDCGVLAMPNFDFALRLAFSTDDFSIPSAITNDVDFCRANFASNAGFPAQQEAGVAAGFCAGLDLQLTPQLETLVADLFAQVGERPALIPLQQAEVPGNVELPTGFKIFNLIEDGGALATFFTETLGPSIPVVTATQAAIADFREIQQTANGNFLLFIDPIQELIRLISGDEDFILDDATAGAIIGSDEFKDFIDPATPVDAAAIIAVLDVVFAQQAFAELLPIEYEEISAQVAQVITILFGFLAEDAEDPIEAFRRLQTENILQQAFEEVFFFLTGGFHVIFSFLDGFTLGDAAAFLQAQGISTGSGNEIGAIFQLVPLNTSMSEVPAVFGQVPVEDYANLQVPGSVGDILFSPFVDIAASPFGTLGDNMGEAVDFILSLVFTLINDALGGISIDTDVGFPVFYSQIFAYFSLVVGNVGQEDLSDLLFGVAFGGPEILLEFLTFEDAELTLNATATRVRINVPLDISVVTEVAEIIVGFGTVAPLFVGSNIDIVVAFDIELAGGVFQDNLEVVGTYNIAEVPGFTIVSNIQPIIDYSFVDVRTWPDAFTVLPFFATCTVGSFGVSHVAHSSVVTSQTLFNGAAEGFTSIVSGVLGDGLNGLAEIYVNLLSTVVDQAAEQTLFQPVFAVDVGTSCTDNPFFVEEGNDDDGFLAGIPTEALIGAGVVVAALLLLVIFFVSSGGSGKYDDEDDEAPVAEAKIVAAEEAEKKEAMEDQL